MRRAAKVDGNHAEVRDALRKIGALVFSTAAIGKGFPDLVVGFRGVNVLLEVKPERLTGGQKPETKKAQEEFRATWPGLVHVVRTPEEAVRVVVEAARPKAGPFWRIEEQA